MACGTLRGCSSETNNASGKKFTAFYVVIIFEAPRTLTLHSFIFAFKIVYLYEIVNAKIVHSFPFGQLQTERGMAYLFNDLAFSLKITFI